MVQMHLSRSDIQNVYKMDDLYEHACDLSRSFKTDEGFMISVAHEFKDAIVSLLERFKPNDVVQRRILAAAKAGAEQIELYRFFGSEVSDAELENGQLCGFATLSLLKGSKTEEFNDYMQQQFGFQSLLELLQREYSPFQVYHSWNSRNTLNRIVVSWKTKPMNDDQLESQASNCCTTLM